MATDRSGLEADPYPVEAAVRLADELGVSPPVAAVLARRGFTEPDAARSFLDGREEHDPDRFDGMAEAVATIKGALERNALVTVYGDFDADGVCATAVLVGTIRSLGGNCDWLIPDRIEDGYGLNEGAVRALAERGTGLLVTVDCGITSPDEVALARQLGMEVVVTDHHRFDPGRLPDCPLLHPEISGYPFTGLCGAGVAAKLAAALIRELDGDRDPAADLDLVALATVADVMPLTGENRHLVREGLKEARRGGRPGMAALMKEARITATGLDAGDLGFRLAPRINAAGRMQRADAGVELFLTDSGERAAEIARELSSVNAERRRVEREVLREAEKALADLPEGPVVVVAGQGWHPGVIGIVASRLCRDHGRPAVVISLDGERGRGSARSTPEVDLHEALGEVEEHLVGFGGHAAAAGLEIEAEGVDRFREALSGAVGTRTGGVPYQPGWRYDAVVGGSDLGLDLAEDLDRLAPFGNSNPDVRLLVPAARVTDLQPMGEGKHCRFTVRSGGFRAAGVRFGSSTAGPGGEVPVDLIAELRLNHWNGSVEPQLVVREVLEVPAAEPLAGCGRDEWWQRFAAARAGRPEADLPAPGNGGGRQVIEWSGLPGVRIGELASSGASVAVVTADARQRWQALGGRDGLARFRPSDSVFGIWEGSAAGAAEEALAGAGLLLLEYRTLRQLPRPALERFEEVVLLDPPATAADRARLAAGAGRIHPVGNAAELEFSLAAIDRQFDPTGELRDLYRQLRKAGAIDGERVDGPELDRILAGPEAVTRSPERAALLVTILEECDLVAGGQFQPGEGLGIVSSGQVKLESSPAYAGLKTGQTERIEFLRQSQTRQ